MAFDEVARATIRAMRDRAERLRPMPLDDVIAQRYAADFLFDSVVIDGIEWLLGYGIEMQLVGPMRHFSISHPSGNRLPADLSMVYEILDEFGFPRKNLRLDVIMYRKRGLTLSVMEPYGLISGR